MEDRNVEVFQYRTIISDTQKVINSKTPPFILDVIQLDSAETSDQVLYDISERKSQTLDSLLTLMIEASIDCVVNTEDIAEYRIIQYNTV